jgi:hypothetical protein
MRYLVNDECRYTIHHTEVTLTPHSAISPRYGFDHRAPTSPSAGAGAVAAIVRRAIRRELEREGVLKEAKR